MVFPYSACLREPMSGGGLTYGIIKYINKVYDSDRRNRIEVPGLEPRPFRTTHARRQRSNPMSHERLSPEDLRQTLIWHKYLLNYGTRHHHQPRLCPRSQATIRSANPPNSAFGLRLLFAYLLPPHIIK